MANVKVTQDKNGVRWLELMRNGSGTLLEIRDKDEALQIISALQHSVRATASQDSDDPKPGTWAYFDAVTSKGG